MTQWHHKSKRKVSGGIRTTVRNSDKKLSWKGNEPTNTTISASEDGEKVIVAATLGGNFKQKLAKAHTVNISTGKKTVKARVVSVSDNKANRLFTRRNIITKGAIIKVMLDNSEKLARVTSRPGQNGSLNAVLVDKADKTENKPSKAAA